MRAGPGLVSFTAGSPRLRIVPFRRRLANMGGISDDPRLSEVPPGATAVPREFRGGEHGVVGGDIRKASWRSQSELGLGGFPRDLRKAARNAGTTASRDQSQGGQQRWGLLGVLSLAH